LAIAPTSMPHPRTREFLNIGEPSSCTTGDPGCEAAQYYTIGSLRSTECVH